MFASVGRWNKRPGEARSRGVILLILVGVTFATIAQLWELRIRAATTTVRVWLELPADERLRSEAPPYPSAAPAPVEGPSAAPAAAPSTVPPGSPGGAAPSSGP